MLRLWFFGGLQSILEYRVFSLWRNDLIKTLALLYLMMTTVNLLVGFLHFYMSTKIITQSSNFTALN